MCSDKTQLRKLSPRTRTGLDGIRAFAAIYVAVYHFIASRGGFPGALIVFRFGQEAVIAFFLLSGFVIYYNEAHRLRNIVGYYLRRIRRIYPLLFLAFLVSTVVFVINGDFRQEFHLNQLLGTILGLQDISSLKPGVIVDPYLGNAPLWTLSYELFFYLIFPVSMMIVAGFKSAYNHIIGLICVVAFVAYLIHPNHWFLVLSYFQIWWVGAMAAKAYMNGGSSFIHIGSSLLWLTLLSVIAGVACAVVGFKGLGHFPFLMFRHFIFAVILCVIGFGIAGKVFSNLIFKWRMQVAWIASISYGVYVLHYPLLVQWNFSRGILGLLVAIATLILLAYLGDRKLNRYFSRIKSVPEKSTPVLAEEDA